MIRAEIREDAVTQSEQRAVVFERDFDIADLTATMNRRLNIFATRFDPLHGFPELHRDPAEQCFFRVHVQLRSETAADFWRDHAQLVFGNSEHERDLRAHEMRNLCRRPECQFFFAREVTGKDAARLHRDGRESFVQHALFDGAIGGRESGVNVAFTGSEFVGDVGAKGLVDYWTAVSRLFDVSNSGQIFIIDDDEIDRVPGCVAIGSDDGGDRMAHKVNLVLRQHAMIGDLQLRQSPGAGHWTDLLRNIVAGINGDHTRSSECGRRVDAVDLCMRVDRANKRDVQRVWQCDVVDVVRKPADQTRIFRALYSFANIILSHIYRLP